MATPAWETLSVPVVLEQVALWEALLPALGDVCAVKALKQFSKFSCYVQSRHLL